MRTPARTARVVAGICLLALGLVPVAVYIALAAAHVQPAGPRLATFLAVAPYAIGVIAFVIAWPWLRFAPTAVRAFSLRMRGYRVLRSVVADIQTVTNSPHGPVPWMVPGSLASLAIRGDELIILDRGVEDRVVVRLNFKEIEEFDSLIRNLRIGWESVAVPSLTIRSSNLVVTFGAVSANPFDAFRATNRGMEELKGRIRAAVFESDTRPHTAQK